MSFASFTQGGYFPEYFVYDGGPLDEDGSKNGTVEYTTYFGTGPLEIKGLGNYIKNTLGEAFPDNTEDKLYSFLDYASQQSTVSAAIYLYTYGHLNTSTNTVDAVSPGAMFGLNPGETLKLHTVMQGNFSKDVNIDTIGKTPESNVAGVAFVESGGSGSTNTHIHGGNVNPKGYGDNVDIEYRSNYDQIVKFPVSSNEGLNWWHPHFHGSANAQVYGGAFGNLQIGDPLQYIPGFENIKRSYIGIKNFNVGYNRDSARFEVKTSSFTPEDTARNINLINGDYQPEKGGYSTGEWNSFGFINYTSNSFYNVKIVKTIDGVDFDVNNKNTWGATQDLYIYGKDGYQTPTIEKAYTGINNKIINGLQLEDPVNGVAINLPSPDLNNNLFLSPARRYETLTYFSDPGKYKIISENWTGAGLRAGGWIWPNIDLGTIDVAGVQVSAPPVLPLNVKPTGQPANINQDLSTYTPIKERRITWSGNLFVEGPNRYRKINGGIYNTNIRKADGTINYYSGYSTPFLINDNVLPYNPAVITQLDTLEYWNHENWASEQHPFHPHLNHFQIISPQDPSTSERYSVSDTATLTPAVRSTIQLFIAYLGRFPNPNELANYSKFLNSGKTEKDLAKELSTGIYTSEFNQYYLTNNDTTRDKDLQIADGTYYTLTRENVYSLSTTLKYTKVLKKVGYANFPLEMLNIFRSGAGGETTKARLENIVAAGLYAINQVATTQPLVSVATSLLRVLNQQINGDPVSVSRLFDIQSNGLNIINDALGTNFNQLVNGEDYEGSALRMDTVALPAAIIKTQSYSTPSSNRYPAPANYNEWTPSKLTTATTYDNYTGGFLQHCHILPHEDSGQGTIVKVIDNMQRSWFSSKSSFDVGESIKFYRSSDYSPVEISVANSVGHTIAFGDVNKDGYQDIVVGETDGGSDLINVYSGINLSLLGQFNAFSSFSSNWNHGVSLDIDDMTGDGLNDIVIGAGKGGGAHLTVFSDSTNGFILSGSITPFEANPELRDSSETIFTLGDFNADNFTDIAFVGGTSSQPVVEVRSSKDGTALSTFNTGISGHLGLAAGFSSFHNLGLETLVMYQKDSPEALVQTATMRAASYVAHSKVDANPFYDQAKYQGYVKSDVQVENSKPVAILSPINSSSGFDWIVNDQESFSSLVGSGNGKLQIKQTYTGILANPITIASSGNSHSTYSYLDQYTTSSLPYLTNNAELENAQRTVISVFVSTLDRLPTPEELSRFSTRLTTEKKGVDYLYQVLSYKGKFDAKNPIATDAIIGSQYDHINNTLTYSANGVVDLNKRSTYTMLGESYKSGINYSATTLANISTYGLYALSQIASDMNVYGDIQMYLGQNDKIIQLLKDSYRGINDSIASIGNAVVGLNSTLLGNYQYASASGSPSSPLANGLNVESATFSDGINTLASGFSNGGAGLISSNSAGSNPNTSNSSTSPSINNTSLSDSNAIKAVSVNLSALLSSSGLKKDRITGTSSNDVIAAGKGIDELTGGGGSDQFIFNTKDTFGKKGADHITDFNSAEGDQLLISSIALPGLKDPTFARASTRKELKGLQVSDSSLIYYQPTGELFYDQNGAQKGLGKGGLFAVIDGGPIFSSANLGILG